MEIYKYIPLQIYFNRSMGYSDVMKIISDDPFEWMK